MRESFGGSQGETRCPADQYITQLRAQLARQAENFFTVAEAAQLMADSRPGTEVKKWVRRIESAAVNGHPIVRAADDRFPLEAASAFRGYSSLVTVAELDAWLESEKVGYLFPKVAQSLDAQASAAPVPATNAIAPLQRAAAQDAAVIACLRRAGHDPLALPTNESGKPGVKAAARAALGNVGLWAGSTVFHKAWERLTRNGDIAYRT